MFDFSRFLQVEEPKYRLREAQADIKLRSSGVWGGELILRYTLYHCYTNIENTNHKKIFENIEMSPELLFL